MKIIADLHIHSKYSRATSKNMDLEHISEGTKNKGLNLIGTGDFTHPKWVSELKNNLTEVIDSGLYQYKTNGVHFILSSEISLMYLQGGKSRRIHILLLAPNFEIVDQITEWLKTKGRVDYDGRPIFGFRCPELAEKMMEISKDIMIIPAHCMTPWYGIFGSKSGFDSVEECFQDQTKNIFALETGLSADPQMLWRISSLDKFALVSNSDSHSFYTWRLGRESNVFDLDKLTYKNIVNAIKEKKNFLYTIEVSPLYGKYHFDGHRVCNVSFSPKEAIKHNNICPVCKKPLTIGVEHRVEELADREEGFVPKGATEFKTLLPLAELIATLYNTQVFTKKVFSETNKLIKGFGSELNVLLEAEEEKLKLLTGERLTNAIMKNRQGKIKVIPGCDGVYGRPVLNNESLKGKIKNRQKSLSDFKRCL